MEVRYRQSFLRDLKKLKKQQVYEAVFIHGRSGAETACRQLGCTTR